MSLKRTQSTNRTFGSGEGGGKVDRQELYDALRRLAEAGTVFAPVDIALSIGAGESQVSKSLLGLAVEGVLEKVEVGKYRATPIAELGLAEFVKAFARASKVDATRQRDLTEIQRLKQNNDTMRQRLLAVIAERDHYRTVLQEHGIDPGAAPVAATTPAAPEINPAPPGPQGVAVPSPASVSSPSGPGDTGSL